MFGNLTGWHFLIIALIVLLLFGATRLPALAKGVGQATKIFRNEIKSQDSVVPAAAETVESVSPDEAAQDHIASQP